MTQSEELSTYIELLVYRMKVSEQSSCDVVSIQEMQVLSFIRKRGSAKMTEIADYLLLGLSNLTAIMDKLVDKKLVIRNRSEEDRRAVFISLTESGQALAKKNSEQKHDLAQQMLSVLNEAEQEKLLLIMRKIIGKLNQEKSGRPD